MATYGGVYYGGAPYAGLLTTVTPTQGVIYNTVLDPAGIPVAGANVTIKLMPTAGFRITDTFNQHREVARQHSTITDSSGFWQMPVEINSNITPALTYYQVTEFIPTVSGGRRVWNVVVTSTNPTPIFSLLSAPTS